jgi:CheY-like chemotaxis protein
MARKPVNVLIVDDDPDWRSLLREVLGAEGYVVREAENGVEAIALLRRFQPATIITDLRMPRMDGRQLLAALRARGAHIPVIVATNESAAEVPGAFRLLQKVIPVEGLLSAVAEAAARSVPASVPEASVLYRRGAYS